LSIERSLGAGDCLLIVDYWFNHKGHEGCCKGHKERAFVSPHPRSFSRWRGWHWAFGMLGERCFIWVLNIVCWSLNITTKSRGPCQTKRD